MKKDTGISIVVMVFVIGFCVYAILYAQAPTTSFYIKATLATAQKINFNTVGVNYTVSGRNNSTTAYAVVDCWDNTTNCKKLENEISAKSAYFITYKTITDTADADYIFVNPPTPTE